MDGIANNDVKAEQGLRIVEHEMKEEDEEASGLSIGRRTFIVLPTQRATSSRGARRGSQSQQGLQKRTMVRVVDHGENQKEAFRRLYDAHVVLQSYEDEINCKNREITDLREKMPTVQDGKKLTAEVLPAWKDPKKKRNSIMEPPVNKVRNFLKSDERSRGLVQAVREVIHAQYMVKGSLDKGHLQEQLWSLGNEFVNRWAGTNINSELEHNLEVANKRILEVQRDAMREVQALREQQQKLRQQLQEANKKGVGAKGVAPSTSPEASKSPSKSPEGKSPSKSPEASSKSKKPDKSPSGNSGGWGTQLLAEQSNVNSHHAESGFSHHAESRSSKTRGDPADTHGRMRGGDDGSRARGGDDGSRAGTPARANSRSGSRGASHGDSRPLMGSRSGPRRRGQAEDRDCAQDDGPTDKPPSSAGGRKGASNSSDVNDGNSHKKGAVAPATPSTLHQPGSASTVGPPGTASTRDPGSRAATSDQNTRSAPTLDPGSRATTSDSRSVSDSRAVTRESGSRQGKLGSASSGAASSGVGSSQFRSLDPVPAGGEFDDNDDDNELFDPLRAFDSDAQELMIDCVNQKVRRILAMDLSKFTDGKLPFGMRPTPAGGESAGNQAELEDLRQKLHKANQDALAIAKEKEEVQGTVNDAVHEARSKKTQYEKLQVEFNLLQKQFEDLKAQKSKEETQSNKSLAMESRNAPSTLPAQTPAGPVSQEDPSKQEQTTSSKMLSKPVKNKRNFKSNETMEGEMSMSDFRKPALKHCGTLDDVDIEDVVKTSSKKPLKRMKTGEEFSSSSSDKPNQKFVKAVKTIANTMQGLLRKIDTKRDTTKRSAFCVQLGEKFNIRESDSVGDSVDDNVLVDAAPFLEELGTQGEAEIENLFARIAELEQSKRDLETHEGTEVRRLMMIIDELRARLNAAGVAAEKQGISQEMGGIMSASGLSDLMSAYTPQADDPALRKVFARLYRDSLERVMRAGFIESKMTVLQRGDLCRVVNTDEGGSNTRWVSANSELERIRAMTKAALPNMAYRCERMFQQLDAYGELKAIESAITSNCIAVDELLAQEQEAHNKSSVSRETPFAAYVASMKQKSANELKEMLAKSQSLPALQRPGALMKSDRASRTHPAQMFSKHKLMC